MPSPLLLETALRRTDRAVRSILTDADRHPGTAVAVFGLMLVALPAAAAANALLGGSPHLLHIYGAAALTLATLTVTGEVRSLSWLNALAAPVLGGVLFLYAPAYALHALTNHLLHGAVNRAALGAVLLVPLVYGLAQVLRIGIDVGLRRWGSGDGGPLATASNRFVLGLPVFFVLAFWAVQGGETWGAEASSSPGWLLLLSAIAAGSVSWAAIPALVAIGLRRLPLWLPVAIAVAGGLALGQWWAAHDGAGLADAAAALFGLGGPIRSDGATLVAYLPFAPVAGMLAAGMAPPRK